MTKQDIINKIRQSSIIEILRNYLTLNKKGANYLAICPFHNDTKPSLTINESKNIWKCFACNMSGDAIKFVSEFKKINFHQAILEIAQLLNFSVEELKDFSNSIYDDIEKYYEINQTYLDFCQMFLLNSEDKTAKEYLFNRGIDEKIIKKFGIGYNPKKTNLDLYYLLTNENNNYININDNNIYTRQDLIDCNLINISSNGNIYDTFGGRIVFSIKNENNKIVGFSGRSIENNEIKYLNTNETKIFKKNQILYNWNNICKNNDLTRVYLVEGFMDVIALDRCGISNAIATMGTSFTNEHLKILKNKPELHTIVLAFDNDEAGYQTIIKTGKKIASFFNVYVVNNYEKMFKDFDEVLNKSGEKQLLDILSKETHFSFFLLNDLEKKSSLLSLSEKNDFLDNAIKIIAQYGLEIFTNQYVDYLNKKTNLDKDYILKAVVQNLKNKSSNEQINFDPYKKNNYLYKKNKLDYDLAKNMYKKVLIAALSSRDNSLFIKEKFPDSSTNKLFELHYDFINIFNIIFEYYFQNKNTQKININNWKEFYNFVIDQNYNFDSKKYLTEIFEMINFSNNNLNEKYKYDDIVKIIQDLEIKELEIRNVIMFNEIANGKCTEEKKKIFLATINKNNNLINKLNESKIKKKK